MQDNAQPHIARRNFIILIIQWPTKKPDLKPIDLISYYINKNVKPSTSTLLNLRKVENPVTIAWEQIRQYLFNI